MRIRKAHLEDIKSIKEMNEISLTSHHSVVYFLKNLETTLVAINKRKIVGYVMALGENILNLVVHPKFRGIDVGKKLVEEVMGKSKKLLLRTRENNRDALNFFKKLGFKEVRRIERYYRNGDNAIEMEWVRT